MTTSVWLMSNGYLAVRDSAFDTQPDTTSWQRLARYDETKYPAIHQQLSDNVKNALWNAQTQTLTINNTVVIDSAWIQARQAELDTAQAKAVARTLMLSDAKNYLSNQLASPQWNNAKLTEVYNTVKGYVDGNPTLLQMVTNQIALCSNSLTWILNLLTPTAIDRQRHLFCVQLVLATIA